MQNNTVFRCAQNWVSVSDGSWTDNGIGKNGKRGLILSKSTVRNTHPRPVERKMVQHDGTNFTVFCFPHWLHFLHGSYERTHKTSHFTDCDAFRNDHWLAKHFQCSKLLLLHHKSGFLYNLLIHNIGQYIDSNTESNQPVPSCWWSTLSQVLFPIFPHHRFQVSFLP